MNTHLKTLESAISDCGFWRWWSAKLPESVQLEFGGTQMWSPPPSAEAPPSGLVALRLVRPAVVLFLTAAGGSQPAGWYEAMHRDELKPFSVEHDRFTLTSHERARGFLREAVAAHALVGSVEVATKRLDGAVLSFWAGPVGFFGMAEAVETLNMQGKLAPAAIDAAHEKWWEYWREYWHRKHGSAPLPRDYACEVCIPAGDG